MALTEQQMVVNHFCMAHNVKLDSKQYGQQLAMAKRLIEKYNRQSIDLIIDYTSVFVKQRIYSIKYFEYIFEETLPKAFAWKKKEDEKRVNSFTHERMERQINNKSMSKKIMKVGTF